VAHERQQAEQIRDGLIGVWSCLESGSSFRAHFSEAGYPQLQYYSTHCKHLYFYLDHPEYGFMNIRFQTWFLYHIQVCYNSRDMAGTSTRGLRYLDRPPTLAGKPHRRSTDEVLSRVSDYNDGVRVRHWVNANSVKVYNEQNVLRVETTINNPAKFRVNRHKRGQNKNEPKSRLA